MNYRLWLCLCAYTMPYSIGKDDILVSVEEFVMQKCFEIDLDADGDNDRYSSIVDGGGWQVPHELVNIVYLL